MNNKEQKKTINKIIKKLKEIRDTEEIEDLIIVRGNENVESLIYENEFNYVTLRTIIEIKSKKLLEKIEVLQKEKDELDKTYLAEIFKLREEARERNIKFTNLEQRAKMYLKKLNEANNELFELRKKVGE